MREGLDAPTFELPAGNLDEIRAFLDGQSRFKLAVWVRHEQLGIHGPAYDHHLVLGVDDEDCATGDMRALDSGMRCPRPHTTEPTWIDIYPVSEVEALRSFGTVVWEQTSPGDDPLDYRLTYEPATFSADALTAFRKLVRTVAPEVIRVTATRSRLWKGESEIEDSTSLCVVCDWERMSPPGPLEAVQNAARDAGIAHSGGSLVRPIDDLPPHATVLYDAAVDG
jgi:hypothetical protein